jgi:hypothetical protein
MISEVFFKLCVAIFTIVVLSGCAGEHTGRGTRLTDEVYPSTPSDVPIEIYSSMPDKPCRVIGQVYASDWGALSAGDPDAVIAELKEQARKLGGTAIVIINLWSGPAGTVHHGKQEGTAKVIRCTEN